MPHNPDAFADMVVLAVKAAMAPVLERIAATEQQTKELQARLAELTSLRDRVTAVETKAAIPPVVAPTGPTSAEIEVLVRDRLEPFTKSLDGLTHRLTVIETAPPPVVPMAAPIGPTPAEAELAMRDRLEPLTKQLATLSERMAVLEVRPPVTGPPGPAGADGVNGKDGVDGLGFDDMDVEFDGDRTVLLKFARGSRVKSWPIVLPFMRQQGVYQEGHTYTTGDVVTWGGSQWHCEAETTTKPGDGSKAWTLVVKRGRDGKDGRDAPGAPPVVSVGRPS